MDRREIDPAVARLHVARPAYIPDEPSLLRQPARALVAVGSIIAIVSSLLPWPARTRIVGDVTRNGWQGLADGFLMLAAGGLWLGTRPSPKPPGRRSVPQ